jgi:diguanylate cyclase (GGDEF)-like protein/PAS domain S-box-containing protein
VSSMATTTHAGTDWVQEGVVTRSAANRRRQPLRILFVHHDVVAVKRCLHELNSMRFVVDPDVALNTEELAKCVGSQRYDLVVAECPSTDRQGMQTMDLLRQMKKETPLIFVTDTLRRENVIEFAKDGAPDCIEMDRIGRLPMAVRRALDEQHLRGERDRAEKELRHSKAHYRALVENSAYGMCRCSKNGSFIDVNQVLVTMLGYSTKEELKSANLANAIIQDPLKRAQLLERSSQTGRVDPVETEWKRKDGTTLTVRLSGYKVRSEKSAPDRYAIIVEDVTDQRALEDQLRKQAASDPLTGLANYRQLVDVLDKEITRSKRTGREFTLLFFDLDGLKKINDQYGHLTGSRALCRLANVLRLCCRSIDTPARYGGDEFALVLPETGAGAATLIARRTCELFASDCEEPKLSVSVGVAGYPKDADSIGTLLYAADSALYSMKSRRKESSS